jgi:hypothetical protein
MRWITRVTLNAVGETSDPKQDKYGHFSSKLPMELASCGI